MKDMTRVIHDVEQGSGDWYALRVGKPTASEFHKIITPKRLQRSDQRKKYAYRLVAERLLNRPMESLDGVEWLEHGKAMEPIAARAYSMLEEVETKKVGFITNFGGRVGASPDRLIIGRNAGVEIKCPSPQVHVGYMDMSMTNDFGDEYRIQVQGQNWVGEFDYSAKYAFNQELPSVLLNTYRDEEVIGRIAECLDQFCDETDALYERLHAWGYFQEYKKPPTPAELEVSRILSAG